MNGREFERVHEMHAESLSYWQSTTPTPILSTTLPHTIDVAVIGGGLLGATTSYWLARDGVPVALLERGALASGATGRNGGFVVAGPSKPYPVSITHLGYATARAIMKVTHENQVLLRQVMQEEEIACDYREPGAIRLALTDAQVEQISQEVAALQADGFSAQFLDRARIQELIKLPMALDIRGGRLLPQQGLLHPARLVQGLVQAAHRRGARAYQTEVHALVPDGKQVRIQTSRGTLHAGKVVVAVNAWTSKLLPALTGIIVPVREQMLAYAPIAPVFTTGLTATLTTDEYWHQTPGGTIVIGGCGSVAPGHDVGIWESQPTAVVQAAIEQVLPRLFPSLARLQVVRRWAGLLDFTSDMQPIVDRAPDMPEVLFVGGFSGHGMPFGMRFGQLLATTVQSGVLPSALKPFRLDRLTLSKWSGA